MIDGIIKNGIFKERSCYIRIVRAFRIVIRRMWIIERNLLRTRTKLRKWILQIE